MAIKRGHKFEIPFRTAFPQGLVLLGEISQVTKYNPNPNATPEPMFDYDPKTGEGSGLPLWKATVTDPHEDKAKRASFEVIFVAQVQPVPATEEIVPGTGMRMIELEGVSAEPKVMGQGEFKYQGYTFRATGIKGDTSGAKQAPNDPGASRPAGSKAA
ncbi:hypothetical protein F5X71_03595 [Nocardia brasiliensis]|uniref:Plasmid replication, integration and excision activator n=1 Tax=Nocardia brasiliensis TaxID=37326 RepID=A0A6G9XKT7_NOCBR|nr:hypothetical protein [Nocardia brasiliensis]QIS01518.1 hypothetical protein F5X71_03595 [Nocardia brasiliensis]